MSLYIVSNADELESALNRASGGDRIELKSGDYGDFFLRDKSYASEVTIAAHDPDNMPTFNTVNLWNVDHLTFDHINFDYTPTVNTVEWSSAFLAQVSSHITVRNSIVDGGNAVDGIDPDSPAGTQGAKGITGFPIGKAMGFGNTSYVTIEDTVISGWTKGIAVGGGDHIVVRNTEMYDIRKVPFGTGNVDHILLEGNYWHDMVPWKFGGLGDHGDFVHIVTTTSQTKPNVDIVVRDNFFVQGEGDAVLGIYLDDNMNNQGFRDVVIEGNVIHNSNHQGIRVEDVVGGVIRDNTMIQGPEGDARDAPGILIRPGSRDLIVENNIGAFVGGSEIFNNPANNITIGQNITVQRHEPMEDNYVGNLFANALTTYPTLLDLRPLPDTMVEGFGAEIALGDGFLGVISETHGDGIELNQHSFSLKTVAEDGMQGTPAGTTVVWDFGDGETETGLAVSHAYARAGTYDTKATVTLADGRSYVIERTIDVLSPVAIIADFENGLRDNSDLALDIDTYRDVQLVDSDHGQAVRLNGDRAALKFNATEEILENPEFSISLAFKKDADAAGDSGRLIHFAGTAVIEVQGDNLVLRGSNSKGENFTLMERGAGISDGDWHQVTYTYSQETGQATLYLDGVAVDQKTGLTGIQATVNGHGMNLGNPYGDNLSGLIDEVSFLRHALDADQVAEHFAAFERNETSPFTQVSDVETLETPDPVPTPAPAPEVPVSPAEPERDEIENGKRPDIVVEEASGEPTPPPPSGFIFDQAADSLSLGRMRHLEESDQLSFSVDYSNADPSHEATRLVWNHRKVGVILKEDGVVLLAATEDEGFKQFRIDNLGLDDNLVHNLTVNIDAEEDRLQLHVDGKMVFEETDTDFELANSGGREHGWHLGSLWGTEFQGSILNFEAVDKFSFDEDQPVIPENTMG